MKKVKVIFEKEENGEEERFGYIIDPDTQTYITAKMDKRYGPFEISEEKPIGEITAFGKSMWRLIRMAISDNGNSDGQSRATGFSR